MISKSKTCLKTLASPHGLAVLMLFGIGVILRVHDIGRESIDLEEYACIGGVHASSYADFLKGQEVLYPYGAPLAPTLSYFWAKLAGISVVRFRIPYAFLGILLLPLGYALAWHLFGKGERGKAAALPVLICIALSPVHIFHSQEARMYALVSFLTLSSSLALYLGLTARKKRYWILHILADGGLIFSHYFTVFLFPVFGIAILLRERTLSRTVLGWTAAHIFLTLILYLWVSAIPQQADELYRYYEDPAWSVIAIHTAAGDSTTLSANSFAPSEQAWPFLPDPVSRFLRESHLIFDGLLIALSLFAVTTSFGFLFRYWRNGRWNRGLLWLCLLLWALLPAIIVAALSWTWQPIYGSRYVMYSVFAVYLMLGGIASRISSLWGRRLLAMLILATYGYQISLALPAQTRTAWRQAYEQIEAAAPVAPIILLDDPFWMSVFRMNLPESSPARITAAFNRETLCEGARMITEWMPSHEAATDPVYVLLVLTTDFDENTFQNCLKNNRLDFSRSFFPGERQLALYRIHRESENRSVSSSIHERIQGSPWTSFITALSRSAETHSLVHNIRFQPDEEGGFWLRLGVELAHRNAPVPAGEAFSRALRQHMGCALWILRQAQALSEEIHPKTLADVALDAKNTSDTVCETMGRFLQEFYYSFNGAALESFGQAAVERAPDCSLGYVYQALAMHLAEKHAEALSLFEQAQERGSHTLPEVAESHAISLLTENRYREVIPLLDDAIIQWPDFSWLKMRRGQALAALGRHEDATQDFREALTPHPEDGYLISLLTDSLLELERYQEAADCADMPAFANRTELHMLLLRWRAYVGVGRKESAAQALHQATMHEDVLKEVYEHLYVIPDPGKAAEAIKKLEQPGVPFFREAYLAIDGIKRD